MATAGTGDVTALVGYALTLAGVLAAARNLRNARRGVHRRGVLSTAWGPLVPAAIGVATLAYRLLCRLAAAVP